MYIHPGHIRFTVALNHAEKFPAISFIEARMVSNQINRGNAFCAQVLNDYMQQMTGCFMAFLRTWREM